MDVWISSWRVTSIETLKKEPLLMRNSGKGFVNVSATAGPAFNIPIAARGAAFGDLNNDGQVDAVVNVLNDAPLILRNDGSKNHWLGITLAGSKSNWQGLGARVVIVDSGAHKQIFDVSTAGSYLSTNDPRILAGLADANGVKSVEVRWPSGRIQNLVNPQIDRYLTINERDVSE